ncbi:asparagine synthase (glutamine-hydrolyzing) [Massilia solisilvae]|uniref:asparagine synthase (glutamine-hydrolyzing) n=1 Tax=Massilia solisilvae TaxID=1811225 RepID=A0ABT2BGG5_9BURK|nr:asparagine synthase (glutamine-hydrolyzing) [Massilia solisilvae]MCS0606993.1 asparagine synthase (glutamine-hydrolyzing) [Massilia solisilvae]
MCGIFGIIHFDGAPVRDETLSLMGSRMRHRGPDDEGHWIDGAAGFGMRRLSIIDLEGGHQPISNEDGTIHLVLNGEIYNYRELREELLGRGHRFKTHSDVEVVLHLYEEMGPGCVERLNGMFAVAIYDQPRKRLWLARDRLGIKPLFYRRLHNGLAFASDLASLAAIAPVELDPAALISYLGYSYIPEPDTVYRGIKKLTVAEQMVIEDGQVRASRYWSPDRLSAWTGGVDEAERRLEELLLDSALLELRSDVPVGIFLSGGVDSSAVAALAARVNGAEAVKTFTIDFAGKGGQDAAYAQMVADRLGAEHRVISVDAAEQARALDELLAVLDEPMSDSAIVPTYLLSKKAREQGVKVLLSGAGGDEVFGGYARHFPGRAGSAAWIAHNPLARTAARLAFQASKPHLAWRVASPARDFAIAISGANLEFLRRGLRDRQQFDGLLARFEQDFGAARASSALARMRLDLDTYLPNNVLALTDKATMAASVEGRVPLLDHRIVEFAFSLPLHLNPLGGKDKGLFKRVLERYVPREVLVRGKEGFNAPMHEWVEKDPKAIREELLGCAVPLLKDMIDLQVVEAWLDAPERRRPAGESLYALYLLNRWLRHHIQ